MAVGTLLPSAFTFDDSLLSNLVNGGALDYFPAVWPGATINGGTVAFAVFEPFISAYDGSAVVTNYDLYYNRIHFTPNPFDFGTVVATAVHTVAVWNAFDVSHTLEVITIAATPDNTTLNTTLPISFISLQSVNVSFTVGGQGLLSLIGEMEFAFDSDTLIAILRTAGNRSALFAWEHNWANPVTETLTWNTEILQAENGREQRRRRRQTPRRRLRQHYLLTAPGDIQKLRRALWRDQRARLIPPLWSESASLSAAAIIGADELLFDTTSFDFDEGMAIILFAREGVYETAVVDEVQPDRLVLVSPLTMNWPSTSIVLPMRRAFLDSELSFDNITACYGEGAVEFLITNEQISVNRWGTFAPTQYRGFPLLTVRSEGSENATETISMREEIFDQEFGAYDKASIGERPSTSFVHRWFAFSRIEIGELLGWLDYFKGRWRPAYWLSDGYDFELADSISENVAQLVVVNDGYLSSYNADTSRRDVAIILKNGTTYTRRIVEAQPGLTLETERISLDAAIPVSVTVDEVDRISFVRFVRLGSDEIQIEWQTPCAAICNLPLVQLETSE